MARRVSRSKRSTERGELAVEAWPRFPEPGWRFVEDVHVDWQSFEFSKIVSILVGLVRRVNAPPNGAAADTNRIQERTMRFMVMAMAKQQSEAAPPPKPEAFAAMQKYNEEAVKAGVLLAAEGLTTSSTRVKFNRDERLVIDGPFAEAKEVIAGFMIIKVKSKEEAIEWVKRAPNASPNGEGEVEIRKLMDIEDLSDAFGDAFTPNEEIAKVKY
jgi:hypothetical protein